MCRTGSFELRIPARSLQPRRTPRRALGEVRSRSQSGADITREFTSAAIALQGHAHRRVIGARAQLADLPAQAAHLAGVQVQRRRRASASVSEPARSRRRSRLRRSARAPSRRSAAD